MAIEVTEIPPHEGYSDSMPIIKEWIGAIRNILDEFEAAFPDNDERTASRARTGRHTRLTENLGAILSENGPMTAPQIRAELTRRGIPFTSNALSVYLTRRFRRLGMAPNSLWTLKMDYPEPSRSRQKQA